MKIPRLERLAQRQREYHRSNPWRLSQGGFFIPYSHADMTSDSLSYWDDVGFIMNGRRVIVWWQHPRRIYAEAIIENAWQEVGDGPRDKWLTEGRTKNYKRVGKSRKKLVSYTSRAPSAAQRQHYDLLNEAIARLSSEGIDHDVSVSWTWKRLNWAMGVSLVAPLDVKNGEELILVANLARRLIRGETTLDARFSGYRYTRSDWLREQGKQRVSDHRLSL